jgi:hypothetical protein
MVRAVGQHWERIMTHVSQSESRLGFQIHAVAFVLTMVLLVAINLWKGEPYWVLWVLLGWGLGIIAHWWFVLGPGASFAGKS